MGYVQPGGEGASWRGRGGGGDVWRENPLPLKCFAHVRQAQNSPPPLIKVHGTSPWENPGRPSRAYVSQRGERKRSDDQRQKLIPI